VQSITVESPSAQLLKLTYTVNKVLNVTGMNEQHAASGTVHAYTYGYDALDRLTSATFPTALGLPASESFAYDAAGSREDPSNASLYDYAANNRIVNEALREGLARLDAPRSSRRRRATKEVSLGRCLLVDVDDVAEALAVADGDRFR
jgi:YD repeat-containing protein